MVNIKMSDEIRQYYQLYVRGYHYTANGKLYLDNIEDPGWCWGSEVNGEISLKKESHLENTVLEEINETEIKLHLIGIHNIKYQI